MTVLRPTPPLLSEHGSGQMLPPTSAKTPLPHRSPVALPDLPPGRVPPGLKPKPRPSYTPAEEASLHVSQLLQPQYTQAARDAALQNDAIRRFTQAIIQQLQGEPAQVQGIYDPQIQQQSQMANAAADSLRAVNPNGDVQKLLDAVGAPSSQAQELAGNLNNTFNGGAAVGQYVNGVLPMGALRSQETAAESLAALQPGFEALRGQQGLQSALAQQADNRSKIAQQAPALEQQWLADFQKNKNAQTQLAIEQRATHTFDTSKSRALGYQVDSQGRAIRDAQGHLQVLPGFTQTPSGAVVKAYAPKTPKLPKSVQAKISPSVSTHAGRGIALDATGQPVLVNGKTIPWKASSTVAGGTSASTPKVPTASQINNLVTAWKTGKSTTVSVKEPHSDANGNAVYKTKRITTGKLSFGQAYKRLTTMGLNDTQARQYLDSAYKRGEQGRGFLTNEERAALHANAPKRLPGFAGDFTAAHVYKGVGYLDQQQAAVLSHAGLMPPGHWINGSTKMKDLGPIYVIAETY